MPAAECRLHVGEPVGQGEGQLLGRRRPGLPDVVARDGNRVPAWAARRAEPHDVGHQAHRRARAGTRTPSGPGTPSRCRSGGCPTGPGPLHPRAIGHPDVHGEQRGGAGVDGHGRGDRGPGRSRRTGVSMSARVSTATPARPTSPSRHGIVGVAPEQRRHVERRREAVAAGPQQLLEPAVGVRGGAEPGELAHGPQPRAVHGGIGAAGVGVLTRQLGALGTVDGLERQRPTSSRSAPRAAASGRNRPATGAGRPPCQNTFMSK